MTREEFDAVKAMAVKAREEQEILNERVAGLEAALAKSSTAKAKAATKPRKTAAPKAKARAKRTPKSAAD